MGEKPCVFDGRTRGCDGWCGWNDRSNVSRVHGGDESKLQRRTRPKHRTFFLPPLHHASPFFKVCTNDTGPIPSNDMFATRMNNNPSRQISAMGVQRAERSTNRGEITRLANAFNAKRTFHWNANLSHRDLVEQALGLESKTQARLTMPWAIRTQPRSLRMDKPSDVSPTNLRHRTSSK